MLTLSFQNPIIGFHSLSYCPFFNSTSQFTTFNYDKVSSVLFISHQKHFFLSFGSNGFFSNGDFSVCEEDYDNYAEKREEFYASFMAKKGLPHWGKLEYDDDDGGGVGDNGVNDVERFSTWEQVEDDEELDVEGGKEINESFVPKKGLYPYGVVEHDDENEVRDDNVRGRQEFNVCFESKKGLPPWGQVEDHDDDDDALFVSKKESFSWKEVVDDKHLDFRPSVMSVSASKEMALMPDHGAMFLEEMDVNVLSNRILALSRSNKIRSAMEYFISMELYGLCPNIHACNSLITSLMRNGWFDESLKVFNFTRTRKITTGHTYSLILMAHVKARGCDSALKFFRELESECDSEKDFDAVVYNTVISICRKVENWDEIVRVWRIMKANGCSGTNVTYRLLVNSFVHCGQSQLALYAYHEMIQNGFEPNSITMNAMISVCAKEGKHDAALSIFQKMLSGRLKPNLIACNALINSLGRAGELQMAFRVYDTMKSLDHKPDVYTFNALISSLNRANRHHDALQVFDMIETDQSSQFNIHLYNTVLMSCSKLHLWDRAIEILWQMEASGLSDLTVSYNLVIRTCELARKPKTALQVYEHMVHQKCSPNMFTCLSIIRCCVRGQLWEELEEILNKTTPNAILYNAAIQGMCLNGKVKVANKVYAKMLEIDLQPDVKTRVLMCSVMRK
ncbi:putative tetratricopeptide-like helical domain-containing protein [Lupinus albus]|uniref:Putative tetratricopeptide-like helical domain-containing protein n=1 Tax=Lupinus albus TaxID=3870 RepID=A0A6A4PU19_LUPAL|nr:putative tetratricopeptide-like helical domain-containing protein [Lupinus albus]